TPCNPTGAVYPHQTVRAIADLAVAHGLWIVADEIYERLTYDAEHHSIAAMSDAAAACTITVGGCSKTYAMTGWRIGYAAAPAHVASAMTNLQDQVTSNAVSFAQKGALRALSLPREQVETMRQEFRARRDLIIQCLAEIPGVATTLPQGAFYVLPNVREFLADGESDLGLAERLLTEARVAVIPGSVFEAPGHLRISYAAGRDQIRAGIARIAEVLSKVAR
ncbi:MAG: aminotransferase class I/II-fold pyridoxal phosphate-dependent enzyme, partial [Fimbriimonas ginsengisoli]|nr:aminotransferase class I/II-fold pyridoxal phosphate-dependent enzyme [Fimbriimonas ginsengisoli]